MPVRRKRVWDHEAATCWRTSSTWRSGVAEAKPFSICTRSVSRPVDEMVDLCAEHAFAEIERVYGRDSEEWERTLRWNDKAKFRERSPSRVAISIVPKDARRHKELPDHVAGAESVVAMHVPPELLASVTGGRCPPNLATLILSYGLPDNKLVPIRLNEIGRRITTLDTTCGGLRDRII